MTSWIEICTVDSSTLSNPVPLNAGTEFLYGDAGAVKAETCDECGTYAKLFYEAKDPGIDPYADDLASLALDLMVSEAGWARHAPNPLLLVG